MRTASLTTFSGISCPVILLVLLGACSRCAASLPLMLPHVVPYCGATIAAPFRFAERAPASEPEFDGLRLASEEGAEVAIACLPKLNAAPTRLEDHAAWIVERLSDEGRAFDPAEAQFEHVADVDRHAVLAATLPAGRDGTRGVLYFTERARELYWVHFSAPSRIWNREARVRATILQSFRVTDATVDRGPTQWWRPNIDISAESLSVARARSPTHVVGGRPDAFEGTPAPEPPPEIFDRVAVPGPVGRLSTYVTPDPHDGRKHPAVVWAHGGFGGIDSWFWEPADRSNDQSARAFREAGIVLAVGSWRAENDNPGDYELYFGEVDDLIAIRDYVAALPYVDPDRIYLAGHSSGGTLVLLAAEKSDAFRAAFSIGGEPVVDDLSGYERYGGIPFDGASAEEKRLRSAAPFVGSIRRPTFYFEGSSSAFGAAQWMAEQAAHAHVPFEAFVALQANHFDLVAPLTELIAQKILADAGPTTSIRFTQREIDALVVSRAPDEP